MKASTQRDDLDLGVTSDLSRPPSCELERAFVRFRAGVAEKNLRCERALDQLVREALSCRRSIEVRGMNQPVAQGLAYRSSDSGITVAERVYGNSTGEIQIAFAICIDELDSFSPHELHWSAFVRAEK